jgi:aldose 1-epimerase
MTPFGTLPDGRPVAAITLAAGDLSVRLLTLGSVLHGVQLAGSGHNLTLASDDPADYLGPALYFGAIVGPVANRLRGAAAEIDGRTCRFDPNQDGRHTLHSGAAGTHLRLWDVVAHDGRTATLATTLPDGEGGFPGTRRITAAWRVLAPATLRLDLTATTDAPTLLNLANHSYWNLDGSPTWEGHRLRIAADRYLPVDDELLPTGEVRPVAGTGFDFRTPRQPRPGDPAIDHNFCLSEARVPLREVLWLTGTSGITLTIATTACGLQVYDGGHSRRPGRSLHEGFAIEPQSWPDAPHNPAFPPIGVRPGTTWSQTTEWRFTRG